VLSAVANVVVVERAAWQADALGSFIVLQQPLHLNIILACHTSLIWHIVTAYFCTLEILLLTY